MLASCQTIAQLSLTEAVKPIWPSFNRKGFALLLLCAGLGSGLSRGGTFVVTTTADSGAGSLRQAILDADTSSGSHTISFQISGTAPFTITPLTVLPSVVFPTLIDGTTQSGFSGTPVIELNGSSAGASAPGLQLASGCVVRGLVINRFSAQGLVLNGASNTVQGCYFGTDLTGTLARTNADAGIWIKGPGNVIGGAGAALRNVISGSGSSGIYLNGSAATNNWIQGNYIGLNVSGSGVISNAFDGITLDGVPGNTIVSNVISGNGLAGIYLKDAGATGNSLWGNWIGLDGTGKIAIGNGSTNAGVDVKAGNGNLLGGTNAGAGNVIAGNKGDGIYLFGGATGNIIQGNFIGLSAAGTNAVANALNGIHLFGGVSNLIGGTVPAARNVISGNKFNGIGILLTNDTANVVAGNYLGTDVSGTKAIPNLLAGVLIQGGSNTVGGLAAGSGNLISGNGLQGIYISGNNGNVRGNLIMGNRVGLNASGTGALANGDAGVAISGAAANQVGGVQAGARNLLSGNTQEGLFIVGPGATNNLIQGNYIGTDVTGTTDVRNYGPGISLTTANGTQIGGAMPGAGNLISANYKDAIYLGSSAANVIQGNLIGTKLDGVSPLGNLLHGVDIDVGSSNNIVGGTAPGAGNVLAYAQTYAGSGYCGVRVRTGAFNNLISGNAIFNNNGLGIDLGTYGTNPIIHLQAGVAGTDANRLQNYPVLTNAVSGTATRVQGRFDGALNKTYALEFFASPTGDATGNGEGQLFLGRTNISVGGISPTNFSWALPVTVPPGWVITATATDSTNNTSEFSNWITIRSVPPLQIAQTNALPGQLALFWSTNSGNNFSLQQATNLASPIWINVVDTPFVTNGNYLLGLPATNPACFYRLNSL
ncbi:MAG TPA: right-handed parallel beta-helix repeat-containing protein [bacterium]|nr:right-handed parallel beta-helix repeat-containing protein [bacterium]